jgi:16S rRNA (guanine527-N7)-methyltransferase
MNISSSQIDEALRPYGIEPQAGLAERILGYIDLLLKWNRKIALTAVTDPAEIVRFHFGESLFAASRYNLQKSRLADVGTGAGFPGLPLALAVPSLSVTLIESNRKKCAFLAEVIRRLAIRNASIFTGRMESFGPDATQFEFIAARAFGQFGALLDWSRLHLVGNGKVLLWLGEKDAEKISSKPEWSWVVPALIPGSVRRYILGGSLQHARS